MAATAVLLQSLGNGVLWDQFGNALNGHNVYVYLRGTTTQVNVYATSALSTPLAQPLVTGTWAVPPSTQPTPGGIPGYVAGEQAIDFYDASSTPATRVSAEPLDATDLIGSDGKVGGAGSLGLPASVVSGQSSGGVPAWVTATAYTRNQLVQSGGITYICLADHTSGGSFPGVGADWAVLGGTASLTTSSPGLSTTVLTPSGGDDGAALNAALTTDCTILLGPGTFNWQTVPQLPAAATGITIRGAGRGVTTIQLSSAAPRAFDLAHTGGNTSPDGAYGVFQNISIEALTIDCNSIGGKHHVVIGGYINGHSMTHFSVNRLRVRRVNTINVPVDKGTAATFTTAFGSNADLAYTATQLGTGPTTSITYVVAGLNTALTVSTIGSAVTVNVATDGAGNPTSTASQVLAAVQAATTLVTVALAPGSSGAGTVAALGVTNFTGAAGPTNHRLNIWLFPATTIGDATQLSITDVKVEDCEFYGGNHGVSMGGTGASNTAVQFDELSVLGCYHTCLAVGNSAGNQAHFFLGSAGSGGRVTIRDCIGYYSGDVGVEVDGCGSGIVENTKMVDVTGTGFFHTAFALPINGSQTDRLVFRNCRAEQLTDQTQVSIGFRTSSVIGGKALGQVDYIDCSYYRTGAPIPNQNGVALYCDGSAFRRVNVERFKATYLASSFGGAQAVTMSAMYFDASLINGSQPTVVTIRDSEAVLNLTQGATGTITPCALSLNGTLAFLVDGFVYDPTTSGFTSSGAVRGIHVGLAASTLKGTIRRFVPQNGAGSPKGIYVGATSTLTISSFIHIQDCDFSAYGSTPAEISYLATSNAAKVRTHSNVYKVKPAPTSLTGLGTGTGATLATGWNALAAFTQGSGAGITAIDYSTNGGTTYTNLLTQAAGALPAGFDQTVGPLPSDALIKVTFTTTQPTITLVPVNP